ncbi:MAG: putative metal-binding motif-containing protein [Candidatus Caldarchaeum sp.]
MKNIGAKSPIPILVPIVAFIVLFSFIQGAKALVYCVSAGPDTPCNAATAATCTGGAACGVCNEGTNGVVCPTIAEALQCINSNNDTNAEIRIGTGAHVGPGTSEPINNSAGAPQAIALKGGFTDGGCTTQGTNPAATVINAPEGKRVFEIGNTTTYALAVSIDLLTVRGGAPNAAAKCNGISGLDGSGGNICITSYDTGGVTFTSEGNIYEQGTVTAEGGAISAFTVNNGGPVTILSTDDTFRNNTANDDGGAFIGVCGATGPTAPPLTVSFDGATFTGNSSTGSDDEGGAVELETEAQCAVNASIIESTFSGNRAANGGALSVETNDSAGNAFVQGVLNVFSNNTATDTATDTGGGAIKIHAAFQGSQINIELDLNDITQNSAINNGGAILIPSSNGTVNATLRKNIIAVNESIEGSGGAIAVLADGPVNLELENNMVFKNIAKATAATGPPAGGGAIAAITNSGDSEFRIRSTNNTYADNQATCDECTGGGLLYDSSAGGTINAPHLNDIIFFNDSVEAGEEIDINGGAATTVSLRYTNIENLASDLASPDLGIGVGYINLDGTVKFLDPLFVNRIGNDYHISISSPANNAGTKVVATTVAGIERTPPDDDIDGDARDIAMGADEPQPPPPPGPGPDADGDGFNSIASGGNDCDDSNAAVNPGATEVCNGIDDNCNGTVDEGFDADGDGVTSCGGDCDDANPAVRLGAPEDCNDQIDNDCDAAEDCADFECNGQAGPGGVCEFETELSCTDGFDNDVDGSTDCNDPDCATSPDCEPQPSPTPSPSPTPQPTPSPIIVEEGGDCSIAGPVNVGAGGVAGALLPLLPAFAVGIRRLLRRKGS